MRKVRLWLLGDVHKGLIPSPVAIENFRMTLEGLNDEEKTDAIFLDGVKLIEFEVDENKEIDVLVVNS